MLELVVAETHSPEGPRRAAGEPGVEVWRDDQGRMCAYGYAENGERWIVLPDFGRFRMSPDSEVVQGFPDAGVRRESLRDTYQRCVLPLALQALGTEVLHASAVRMPHGVVALCGVSGAGKSTIAYGLARRGHCLWADDAVALAVSDTAVGARLLPFRLRLRPASTAFYGTDGALVPAPAPHLGAHQADAQPEPLAALFVLIRRVVPEALTVRRLAPAAALSSVLPHAYCFSLADESRKRRMLGTYFRVAAHVPVFEIAFGGGLDRLHVVLDAIDNAVAAHEA